MDPKRSSRPGAGPTPAKPLLPKIIVQKRPGAGAPRPGAPGGSSAAPAPRLAPPLGETLDQMARDIRQLQIDYERFFNGGLPVPPEELRNRIQTQIRSLRTLKIPSTLDSYRLGDLEARFNSYNEMFNRRLRDREEGRHPGAAHTVPVERRRYDPREGITLGGSFDPEAVEALYQGLASRPGDGPKFDLDSFEKYLSRQVAALREKTGCDQVQFRLAEEEGKVKLKARPVPRSGS
ncbi:MAG TPA: MXAN_5187 C-terminal domain-containing protein [Thermoanaerobaculia bacterium]|nr:MXAN_5187 C-terminal domain-containing protein [Thermoanaerobaculia bacterium]